MPAKYRVSGQALGKKKNLQGTGIKNEASNDLKNLEGTSVVDSATDQFFINVADNGFLNHKNNTSEGFGYAVFGKVLEGMGVVHEIEEVPTGNFRGYSDVPMRAVTIISATQLY